MLNLSVQDAKLQYIRNWQALQDFGIIYFLVKQGRSKKEVRTCACRHWTVMYRKQASCNVQRVRVHACERVLVLE